MEGDVDSMDLIKEMQAVRTIFFKRPEYYELLNKQLQKADHETQDLLHVLEFGKLDAVASMKITKDLKKLRKERRLIKKDLELLRIVYEFVEGSKGKSINKHDVGNAIGELRKAEKMHERRTYTMRVRSDLQSLVD